MKSTPNNSFTAWLKNKVESLNFDQIKSLMYLYLKITIFQHKNK
jgi:hypothetical protein